MSRRAWKVALLLGALCVAGLFCPLPGRAPLLGVRMHTEGAFPENGVFPLTHWLHRPPGPAAGSPQVWGSWAGNDAATGSLVLGPFTAPDRFWIAISGGPNKPGNALFLVRVEDGARWPLAAGVEPGTLWEELVVELSQDWIGKQVELHATDGAQGPGGWLGVSTPYQRGTLTLAVERWRGILPAFALHVVCLLAIGWAGWTLLARRVFGAGAVPTSFAVLGAASLSALTGYGVFWVYLASPTAGRVASCLALAAALAILARRWFGGEAHVRPDPDVLWPLALMALTGVFYLGLLGLPLTSGNLSGLAQSRFSASSLPGDNLLPGIFAERLYAGQDPRVLQLEWHSADRPPLQTGVQLLARPLLGLLGVDADTAGQTGGIVFQLLWVPAAWCFLRWARLPVGGAVAVVVALVPTGFFLVESTFVWPKMAAGALAVGAFNLFFQQRGRGSAGAPGAGVVAWASGLAALGYLSHGGVMFSLAAFALLLCLPPYFLGWRRTLLGAAVFVALNLPWSGYQKFYDPPGNRLLKWHLAGVVQIDPRGTGETLRTAYTAVGLHRALEVKWLNFQHAFHLGDSGLLQGRWPSRKEWRNDEFCFLIPSFGLFNLGWLLAPAVLLWRWRAHGRLPRLDVRAVALALAACLLTAVVWSALLFELWSTVIFTCSYALSILALVSLAALLWEANSMLFAIVAVVNAAIFAAVYVPVPPAFGAKLDPVAVVLALGAGGALVGAVVATRRAERRVGAGPGLTRAVAAPASVNGVAENRQRP